MPPDKIICCYVVRHGTTVLNRQGCFRGNADVPLDEKGIRDAHTLANLFAPIEVSCIVSSDRQRATKTAQVIAQKKNIPVHTTESLRALNVGEFSGQKRTAESEARLQEFLDTPDQCVPGGESLNDFKARIRPCIMEAIKIFEDCGIPPLLVAHSSIVHETGAMFYGDHKSILVHPGGALAVYYDGGQLKAEPIFKPVTAAPGTRAHSIS